MEDYIDNEVMNTEENTYQDNINAGYNEYDTNGDGVVDTVVYEEDTDGDGYSNIRMTMMDSNYDGYADTSIVETDEDGDGYMETMEAEVDTNGDGQSDIFYSGVDANADGVEDIVEIQQDTNGNGVLDSYSLEVDSNGDGMTDYAVRATDYNEDGNYDSIREYEDSDMNGNIDTVTEYYDSNNDGLIDRADVHHDYDGDGKVDWTDEYAYNPQTGEIQPLNDNPSYGEGLEGTYHDELNQYEPGPDYPANVSGDPSASMEHWEFQGDTGRCALYSQKFIIEEFTGQEIPIEDMVAMAEENGWFSDNSGSSFLNINKMLDAYGVENEMSFHNDISDIDECLQNGGRVIVAIDADEIWYGEGDDMFSPNSSANHAVEVIGIDYSNPDNPMVILNDSGNPYGRGEMIPLEVFLDAWQDSECQMIACYPGN